jgi:hypothetical protein
VSVPQPESVGRGEGAAEFLAGFLAAAALTAGAIAVAYHPVRLGAPAIVLALVAAGMTRGRHERLARFAVFGTTLCWIAGMILAVLTRNPLW